MRNKIGFENWMNIHTELRVRTKKNYIYAIDTISRLYDCNLYDVTDMERIDSIMSSATFIRKNKKENNVYSAAIGHFKIFLKDCYDEENFESAILKEKLKYDNEIKEVEGLIVTRRKINDKPEPKPNFHIVNNKRVWKRNPLYAVEALNLADYCCGYDKGHKHFISKATGQNYVEAHHLIPIKFQDDFENSLDVHANIVSLCVVCHKEIHLGLFEDKRSLLEKLFNSRKERLKAAGINISLEELYKYYADKGS